MGRKSKGRYEVRIRVQTGLNKWVKKSRFYDATSPGDAGKCYDGPGDIMWVEKVPREKFWGVGEFFKLGDSLLQELKEDTLLEEVQKEKEKVRQKRYYHSRVKSERGY